MTENERPVLETTAGEIPLHEYRLRHDGREWAILHAGAVLTDEAERHVIENQVDRLPYGVTLWPSSIALSHEIAGRAAELRGRSVLELGAGTGLPGIVAAAQGATVVQTDRDELSLALCRRNGRRNGLTGVEYRLADWSSWAETGRYDLILGSDVLYAESLHPRMRQIFEQNLAPGGRVLLADPLRPMSLGLLESMERDGWGIAMSKWDVDGGLRPIAVFELTHNHTRPPS